MYLIGVARVFENPGTRPDPTNFTRPDNTFLKPEPARVFSKPAGTRGNTSSLQRLHPTLWKNVTEKSITQPKITAFQQVNKKYKVGSEKRKNLIRKLSFSGERYETFVYCLQKRFSRILPSHGSAMFIKTFYD